MQTSYTLSFGSTSFHQHQKADWCSEWLMIKLNMKQMGLHSELGNITGMEW